MGYSRPSICTILTIVAILTIGAILAVLSVVDSDGVPFGKSDGVTNDFAFISYGLNICNVVAILLCSHNGLQCINIAVHLAAHLLKSKNALLQIFDVGTNLRIIIVSNATNHQTH